MIEFIIFSFVLLLLLLGVSGISFACSAWSIINFFRSFSITFFYRLHTYSKSIIIIHLYYYYCHLPRLSLPVFWCKENGWKEKRNLWCRYWSVVGFFFIPPVGFVLGPFFGAFFGALIDNKNKVNALKIAFGSFVGFVFGTLIKLFYSIYVILWVAWKLLYLS